MNLNNLSASIPSPNLVENSFKNRPKDYGTGSGFSASNKSSNFYKNFHRSKEGSGSRSRSSSCSSNTSSTPIPPSSQSENTNIKRYTRSTLYLLRNESFARRRPDCGLRCELQSLGVWKFSITNSTSISSAGGGSTSQTFNGNNNIPKNNGSESSITGLPLNSGPINSALGVNNSHLQHANSRTQQRVPAVTSHHSHIYTQSNQYQNHSLQKLNNNSSNYLDHRSISSSHLMPAFAKRRIAVSGSNISNNRTSATQNVLTNASQNSIASSSASNDQSDTNHNESEVSNYRHQQCRQVELEGKMGSANYLSSQRSDADNERERGGSQSPILPTTSSSIHGRHTGSNTVLAPERRIGSGRLLPRDVTNWSDYSSLTSYGSNSSQQDFKDGNKPHTSAMEMLPPSSRNPPRGHGIFDRSSTNIDANASTSTGENLMALIERRSYEHRPGISNNDEASRYRTAGQDAHQTLQQSRHNRRQQQTHTNQYNYHNHYIDRLEEPEWFSGGPTSQHDTIELRGFDETDENYDNVGSETHRYSDKNNLVYTCKNNENASSQTSGAASLDISKIVKNKLLQRVSDLGTGLSTTAKGVPLQNKSVISDKNSTKICASSYNTDENHSNEEKNYNIHIVDAGNDSDNVPEHLNSLKKKGKLREACSFVQEQNLNNKNKKNFKGIQSECDKMFSTFFQGKQTPTDSNDTGDKNLLVKRDHADIEMLDAFFKSDSLKHTLLVSTLQENSSGESIVMASSRFSRWFVNEGNNEDVNNSPIINEIESSSEKISFADNDVCYKDTTVENNTLLEFIQRSKLPRSLRNGITHPNDIPSVGELEAKMRQIDVNTNNTDSNNTEHTSEKINNKNLVPQESQTPGEIEAFKKLLEQLGTVNKQQNQQQLSEQAHSANHQSQMSFNTSSQLTKYNSQTKILVQTDNNLTTNIVANVIPNAMLNIQVPKEDVQKLQQQIYHQQQMPQQNHVHTQLPMSPQIVAHALTTNESATAQNLLPSYHMPLLTTHLQPIQKRLDPQYLLQCVSRGEIPVSFLEQELNNPNVNSQVREIITAALRRNSPNMIPSANQPIDASSTANGTSKSSASNTMQMLPHHIQQQNSPILSSQSNAFRIHSTSNGVLSNSMVIPGTRPSVQQQQPIQQGIATPKDSGFNTQTFMQTAAINKKIDEQQHETLKKQQQSHLLLNQLDSQQKMLQQSQQHQRHLNSPTPLAFTPTSVLRKMTADKESTSGSSTHISPSVITNNLHQQALIPSKQQNPQQQLTQTAYLGQQQPPNTFAVSQPRMILGVGSGAQHMQHQNNTSSLSPQHKEFLNVPALRNATQQQIKWPCTSTHQMVINQMLSPTNIKPLGRPILKGSTSTQQPHQSLPVQTTISPPQMTFATKIETQQLNQHQQQHKLKQNITPQHMVNHHSQQHIQQPQQQQAYSPPNAHITLTQQQQQLYQHQQQLRVLAFQRQQHFQQQFPQQQQLHQRSNHQQYDTVNRSLCPVLVGGNGNACPVNNINSTTAGSSVPTSVSGASAGVINYQREGGLSPTSNQLAQWFSPELLAQASAGKLPLLNVNQALSLEEFERSIQQHSSTTAVHN